MSIISDRDVLFCRHFWRHIFAKLNVTRNMSSGEHPQTDGQTKRVTKYSKTCCVLMYLIGRHIAYLPLLEFAYNNRPHKVTGLSLFVMNYGMSPLTLGTIGSPQICPTVVEFLARMQETLRLAKTKLQ